ncbi:MAG: hypothetical protein V4714_09845 [Bacteroidota bacterium]
MTTTQLNQLDMYLLVKAAFMRFSGVWSNNARLTEAVSKFSDNNAAIHVQKKLQEEDGSGITQDKNTLKAALIKKAVFVSKAVASYAFSVNNQELEISVKYPESDMKTMREAMLPAVCEIIRDKAQANLDKLGDEGITAATLDSLTQLIYDYSGKKTKPKEAINDSKDATETLAGLFRSNNTMLKKQMDGLMAQYEESAPEFYQAYVKARPINDRGRRGKVDKVAPPQG